MFATRKPIIDERNPLYCPAISPQTYMRNIQSKLGLPFKPPRGLDMSYEPFLRSYPQKIFAVLNDIESTDDVDLDTSLSQSSDVLSRSKNPRYRRKLSHPRHRSLMDSTNTLKTKKRKRDLLVIDDLVGSPKRTRSFVDEEETQAVLYDEIASVTLVQPDFFFSFHNDLEGPTPVDVSAQLKLAQEELYGPAIGSETPRGLQSLLNRILVLLPVPRLRSLLAKQHIKCHQQVVDILAAEGFISGEILTLFRNSEITSLTLTSSLLDENGLNLSAHSILPVLSKPYSFYFLSDLIFNDAPIQDSDLVHISRLPKLSTLSLNNTNIGDEAIYLLVPLKRTLKHLSIAGNADISDAVAPALCLFRHLAFLSILDTGISMIGLRRLAHSINDDNWDHSIDIEIPEECERYVDNMKSFYMVDATKHMVTHSSECDALSVTSLRFNLTMHAQCNPGICTGGTKSEMVKRLKGVLQLREEDLVVRGLVCGDESD